MSRTVMRPAWRPSALSEPEVRADYRGSPRGSPPCVTRWIVWCWLDSTSDLSSADSTQAYCVDVEHQPTDLAVRGSNPSRATIDRRTRRSAAQMDRVVPTRAA
jgi:hypothetical protein